MTQPARSLEPRAAIDALRYARQVLRAEGEALFELARRADRSYFAAATLLVECAGNTIVTGMGKAGLIGQKIAATLASTGTPSHFLHPAEAVHGDLGRVRAGDVVLALSKSGETDEMVRLLPLISRLGAPIIALTGRPQSRLGRAASVVIDLGPLPEACFLGLAPTTSTTAMLAAGDALALLASRAKQFGREDFNRFHPGGSLGRQLSKVEDHMRPLADCRVAAGDQTVRQVLVQVGRPGRRSGAILLVDERGLLCGIFTDSDLARLFEQRRDEALDRPIAEVMTSAPRTVEWGSRLAEAVELMALSKISELPVVNAEGQPQGLIDVTDIVGLVPELFEPSGKLDAAAADFEEAPRLEETHSPAPKITLFREPPAADRP